MYFYATVPEAAQSQIEPLVLRDAMQGAILARQEVSARRGDGSWLAGAHNYNRYRSRPEAPLDETECLLEWIQQVACTVGPQTAVRWLSGLRSVFDLAGRTELRELLEGCRSLAAVLRALAGEGRTPREALREAARPRFESGLAVWLEGLIQHRVGRRMKIGAWPSELRRLDRIALHHGVNEPEQLTGAMLEDFLRSPTARTRNGRLSKLRSLARFLAPRGRSLDLSGWRTAPEPPFRPHLYTLREIGCVLEAMRERGRSERAFHWLGLETVVFLLYACGMRLREPLGLRVRDVCLRERALFLHCTKFYKQRWVPLGESAWRRLESYAEVRRAEFPERGEADEPFFLGDYGRAFTKGTLHNAFFSIRR